MAETQWTDQQKAQLRSDALAHIIPHFASNENLAKGPRIFTRGEGCYVYDLDGKRYFDSFATLLTTTCGHNRPEVIAAVKEQMETLEFFPNYVDTFTVPLVRLAKKLAEIMPGELSVSFFVNSGSEANETALKMARQYHVEKGHRERFKFIGRKDSYHATTLGGSSVTGLTWFREYFEPLMPGCIFAPAARQWECPENMTSLEYGKKCLEDLEDLILFESPETIAGMIMDPLPGSNTGYPLPPEGYLEGVRELCDMHGILLIFDEVQTGFGKTGKWFFCEHYGVVPDIMTIGKGFTGGHIPLGAAVTTPKIADAFRSKPGSELRSGSTYGGHTVACAATLANIEIIERENLVAHAADMGAYLEQQLGELWKKHAIIGSVRGIGLLWAIMLVADRATGRPIDSKLGVGNWIQDWCYQNELILRNNGEILVLAPSLIITREEIDMLVEKMDRVLEAAAGQFGLSGG
jgi:adenosylmethionine-8-amino-7-oxononanoate aminotransferase